VAEESERKTLLLGGCRERAGGVPKRGRWKQHSNRQTSRRNKRRGNHTEIEVQLKHLGEGKGISNSPTSRKREKDNGLARLGKEGTKSRGDGGMLTLGQMPKERNPGNYQRFGGLRRDYSFKKAALEIMDLPT